MLTGISSALFLSFLSIFLVLFSLEKVRRDTILPVHQFSASAVHLLGFFADPQLRLIRVHFGTHCWTKGALRRPGKLTKEQRSQYGEFWIVQWALYEQVCREKGFLWVLLLKSSNLISKNIDGRNDALADFEFFVPFFRFVLYCKSLFKSYCR